MPPLYVQNLKFTILEHSLESAHGKMTNFLTFFLIILALISLPTGTHSQSYSVEILTCYANYPDTFSWRKFDLSLSQVKKSKRAIDFVLLIENIDKRRRGTIIDEFEDISLEINLDTNTEFMNVDNIEALSHVYIPTTMRYLVGTRCITMDTIKYIVDQLNYHLYFLPYLLFDIAEIKEIHYYSQEGTIIRFALEKKSKQFDDLQMFKVRKKSQKKYCQNLSDCKQEQYRRSYEFKQARIDIQKEYDELSLKWKKKISRHNFRVSKYENLKQDLESSLRSIDEAKKQCIEEQRPLHMFIRHYPKDQRKVIGIYRDIPNYNLHFDLHNSARFQEVVISKK